jgi:predicted flap endonuclease-1-like 5' DNA nuclease
MGETKMSRSIQDIEGIGPKYAQLLNQAGIKTTGKLLETGGNRAGRRLLAEKTSINEKNILKWVNMADLFRVKGVAGQFAELLEGAGVDTVKELRNRNDDNLAEKMAEVNKKKHRCKATPSSKMVTNWVGQAKKMAPMVTY